MLILQSFSFSLVDCQYARLWLVTDLACLIDGHKMYRMLNREFLKVSLVYRDKLEVSRIDGSSIWGRISD